MENKKPLERGANTIIIQYNVDEIQTLNNIPEVLKEIVELFRTKHKDTPTNCILNVLIAKMAQMITSKRVKYQLVSETGYPNWYSILFMESGAGKDFLVKDLDRLIFNNFKLWFLNEVEKYKRAEFEKIEEQANKEFKTSKEEPKKRAFIEAERAKVRNIFLEVTSGTQEGFYSDAEALSGANFGSIFLKISELGNFLSNITTESRQFLNCLFDAYDGKIVSKSIKGENRKADLENIPTNALMYSDPNSFLKEVKNVFRSLMLTGIGRRATVSYRPTTNLVLEELSFEQIKDFEEKASIISEKLNKIFFSIGLNATFEVELEAYNEGLLQYKLQCKARFNNLENDIAKREINSRYFKALKLSCLYACLNHPETLKITLEDVSQAITTTEALGKDLDKFIKLRPKNNDKYDNLFNYLKEHLGEKFKKTDFLNIFKQVDGLVRSDIKENFDKTFAEVSDIARNQGFHLMKETGYNNLGENIYLMEMPSGTVTEMKELLNAKTEKNNYLAV